MWNEFQEACDDPARPESGINACTLRQWEDTRSLALGRAARCRERRIARAIFLYPTRGTATEGFRDYVGHGGWFLMRSPRIRRCFQTGARRSFKRIAVRW